MLPRNIKQFFSWCELVFVSMPHIANGIRKLVNYPVTDFSDEHDAFEPREATRELTDKLRLKSFWNFICRAVREVFSGVRTRRSLPSSEPRA